MKLLFYLKIFLNIKVLNKKIIVKKGKTLYLFVLFFLCVLIFSFSLSLISQSATILKGLNPPDTSIMAIEANELILKNKENPDFVIIDVRTPEEYNDGHIEGSINIDYKSENFKSEISELKQYRTYLVYCRSGKRSKAAQDIMFSSGFINVINLTGGFEDWKKELLPFVK
jgi:rhodanese-related sulfurtransferase